jgi:amino acid adenylation domain-containing protein
MKRRPIHSRNNTREQPPGLSPHELIQDQAKRTPDAIALIMGAKQLTYRELNARANQLAHYLREHEIGPENLVGVYLDRSFEMIVAFLAILKAGGVYLPLDPKFPKPRLAFMIADAEVPLLITQRSKRDSLPETTARVVLLDEDEDAFSKFPRGNLSSSSDPGNLAYTIYTSGSTGNPKGVMIPRSALVNFLHSMADTPGLTAADVLLAVTTISFDISILESLLPLTVGAQVVIATPEQAADARELRRLLDVHAVTVMQATPTTWRMLMESGWEGKSDLRIFCGGEALPADLVRLILPRCRELWNMYGPTETTIWSSTEKVTSADLISLGPPIASTQFYVVDEKLRPVQPGSTGELLIGGDGLARGYLKRPELTAEKFIPDPFSGVAGARLYRTGDEVRCRADGTLEFLGRLDHQVKLRGFRIELGEIESTLARIEGIRQAVVVMREDRPGDKRLVAYYTGSEELTTDGFLQALKTTLPVYMIPSFFLRVEQFPQTPNGKLDRKALPAPHRIRPQLAQEYIAPRTALEKQLAELWCELLDLDEIGIDDGFFDLGGASLEVVRMTGLYHSRHGREIPPVKVFQFPTIAQLCRFLEESDTDTSFLKDVEHRAEQQRSSHSAKDPSHDAVAVIGMVGRFPGADNLEQLWRNLCNAKESITFFKPEELGPGIEEHLKNDPDYIRARGIIEGADLFDAAFFGIGPLEAKVTDPQQRVFLELAQQALENAGYDPDRYKGLIGVFAGIGDNHYYTTNLLTHPDLLAMAGKLAVEYGNEKDYIALRTAYALDLRGPAVSLNTACSTTLLTIDSAYHALLDYECDMALAGGIDIGVPQRSGFLYQDGGTFAKDGHCRPFDADATGTMFCDGAGIVVLKRLADALADGDTIYAVLRGSGKNNNGARPASFLAPSVSGQAEVIAMAQARANVPIETIRYIEAHGTGTPVGDPIEIEALCKVFESKTDRKQFCYIGSIKGNIGHPTNAAGVAGLIKAAMVLHREQIPATLHFKKPNPKIDFANSPFMIADRLISFPRSKEPRRAAVSSFGFGGTNVHTILEEAPLPTAGGKSRPVQLLLLSARTPAALDSYGKSFAAHLENLPEPDFANAAYTLQKGRKQMAQRRFVVAADSREAVQLLQQPNPLRCGSKRCERRAPPVVFLFGGQGTQYVNMGHNLYHGEPLFRAVVDDCCDFLKPHLGRDLRELLYPRTGDEETARTSLQNTFYTQPSIFVIEYALARFWQSLGLQPAMMAGHSIGEFVAATLAGVWELQDALRIIALRGQLMQKLPQGSMLAVGCSAEQVERTLPPSVQIASNNAPSLCVVSGPETDVAVLKEVLEGQNIVCRHLHTSHAFHSEMMDPMVEPLRAEVGKVRLKAPTLPFVSTVTGELITDAQATDPRYWAQHARATVKFSKAVHWLVERQYDLFLECGPRSTLSSLVRQHFTPDRMGTAIPTLSDTHENNAEWAATLFALGSLWQNGVSIDWDAFYAHEDRRRIPLPTYPFERQRYWIDPAPVGEVAASGPSTDSSRAAEKIPVEQPIANAAPALLAGEPGSAETHQDRIAARLVEILVPVTGRERSQISTSATFLEQGFDSLSLTQVAFAIRKEFGVKVTFSQLMNQLPNIDIVATHLDKHLPSDLYADSPPAKPVAAIPTPVARVAVEGVQPKTDTLEAVIAEQARTIARLVTLLEAAATAQIPAGAAATSATTPSPQEKDPEHRDTAPPVALLAVESTVPQRGIFFSSRLSSRLSASYNESMTLRFTGTISVPRLIRSVERLVQRHDALRASFDELGSLMQISSALRVAVPVTDLSNIADQAEREKRLQNLISQETALPFTLPGGPLFRGQIVLLAVDTAAIVFTGHHIVCDGWSLDVLIHDLCAFYSEEISGAPVPLRPAGNYVDFVQSVTQRTNSAEFREAREYWHTKFAGGFPVLVLPTDRPRTARRDFTAHRLDRSVALPAVQGLRALGVKQGCSFFTVVLGALSILLARLSRERRFVIALPTAEQPVIGQPDLVGHCVSLLPFVVDLQEAETISDFLARVQRELGAAHDHSAFTLVSLLQDLRPGVAVPGVSPISAGLTSVKKYLQHELPQSGFSADYDANPKSFESFEWYLNAVEVDKGLELKCHYDTGLFDDATAEKWLSALDAIFRDMVADPSRKTTDLTRLDGSGKYPETEAFYILPSNDGDGRGLPVNTAALAVQPSQRSDYSAASPIAQEAELLNSMLALWQQVLGVRVVSPDDNFFSLGGNSMVAAQLFARIERKLSLPAPLSALYDAPTPRALVGALTRCNAPLDWDTLVPINRSGNRYPLFLIHAAEGNVLLYRELASHLGTDQPVYGLQSAGLDGKSSIDGRFEHVAERYIKEIRKVQPSGPYMLGGYCLGGTLAMEMARQLLDAGETIGLVAMIDNFNIRAIQWPLPWHLRLINRGFLNLYYHMQNIFAAQGASRLKFFTQKLRVEMTRAKVSARIAVARAGRLLRKDDTDGEFHHIKVADVYDAALAQYDVKPYPGELTVFLTERRLAGFADRMGGWGDIAQGGVRLYSLPISPKGTLVEPYVQQLAALLRECLDQAAERQQRLPAEPPLDLASAWK